MAKLLVFFLLIATAVAVLSAPTTDENPAQSEKPHKQNSHFSKCEKIFTRDPSGSVPEDVYNCSHECLIYKKYSGGYSENGSCRCC
ncbi:hypothetical protein KQX54_002554 [Cotesia glomerata]|uniref:Uncharacterized protein n=1 Tax=Cotesia glomerata TaxID=32391 RepID=A0AAV7IC88_COTGL|nr:hypothetical protein KQX54_002554 [Cotesia glomerata]